jgi:hypothetical protein
MKRKIATLARQVTEWGYASSRVYPDPFNEVELDVILTHASGKRWRVPTFWAGGQEWRVRFAAPLAGSYEITTACSDRTNAELHGVGGVLEAAPYTGDHPLLVHGPLRVAASKRTFEHEDGTPFFWLADTWWMGLCQRMAWPQDFQLLAADRVAKGFSVVQIVAGLYPDMPGFDERGANEAGFPWEKDYGRINPAYFDMADLRIGWLARAGLVACIVGAWGYYLPLLGSAKMKQHWRYLIARWGAYPVVWCLAGEATMPFYLATDKEGDRKKQMIGWTEIGQYVRETDPYSHPVTIHPTQVGRDQVTDDSVLDFDMLQTGHGGYGSVSNTVSKVIAEHQRQPAMPVIVGEVSYEGILHGTQAEVQRLTFWAAVLSGAAGHTYGANGIWQVNTRAKAYGPSPHGGTWGNTPWEEAYLLPGASQIALGAQLLKRYPWWQFEAHQEWVKPAGSAENVNAPFAAGIPGRVRIVYFYNPTFPWDKERMTVMGIEAGVEYRAFFWNPRNGEEHELGRVAGGSAWEVPVQSTMEDWVLVMEAVS